MKLTASILTAALAISLVACGESSQINTSNISTTQSNSNTASESTDTGEKIPIVISHADPEDAVTHLGILKFKEYVESKTDKFDIQIYPNGQLGGERETVEATSLGSIQVTIPTASIMSVWGDKYNLLELPFLFSNYDQVNAAYDGELGQLYAGWMEEHNLLCKGYYAGGFRAISNNKKPVRTPDDLSGLKIRCIESDMFLELFKLLGTNPTPMSFSEIYTGLEQGTIDGQDNPAPLTFTSKFYENLDYFTQTNHVCLCDPICVQKDWFEALDPELQQILDEAFSIQTEYCREAKVQEEQDALKSMEEYGVEIIALNEDELALFREKVLPIHDQYREIVGDEVMDLALSYSTVQ